MTLNDLTSQLTMADSALTYQQGIKDTITEAIATHEDRLQEITELTDLYNRTGAFLQHVSAQARMQVAGIFEQMVTEALQTILETTTLEFKVHFTQKKNGTDVSFTLYDSVIQRELDITRSFGGGVKDIVSTILRVVVLELHKPSIAGPIVLDEVGKNISKEYQENFGTFLQTLSQKLDRQIILVTHSPIIAQAAEKVIQISKDSVGKAVVTEGIL